MFWTRVEHLVTTPLKSDYSLGLALPRAEKLQMNSCGWTCLNARKHVMLAFAVWQSPV